MVDFPDVILTAGKQKKRGSLTLPTSAPFTSIDFKPKTSSKTVAIKCSDISAFYWWLQFDGFSLRLDLNGGAKVKFTSLPESALQTLQAIANNQQKQINKYTLDTKGGNAGMIELKGKFNFNSNKNNFARPRHRGWKISVPHFRSQVTPDFTELTNFN